MKGKAIIIYDCGGNFLCRMHFESEEEAKLLFKSLLRAGQMDDSKFADLFQIALKKAKKVDWADNDCDCCQPSY